MINLGSMIYGMLTGCECSNLEYAWI